MEDEYLKFIEFYLEFTGKHCPVTYHEFTNIFSNESKLKELVVSNINKFCHGN